MTAIVFDSHKYARRLTDAGLPAQAADIQAETMVELMNYVSANLSQQETQDGKIDRLGAKIDSLAEKIDEAETRFDEKIGAMESRYDDKLGASEARFDEKLRAMEARFDAKIADAKAELIRWMVGMGVLQLSLISALLLRLTH